MAGKRKIPLWRQTFLRALARTGNVRASAFEAGVNAETAYNHRAKDPAFAEKWAAALARFKASGKKPLHRLRRSPSPGKPGEELVLRRTKHGDQLIRAGPGRWCAEADGLFFATLGGTACVRAAAAACGFSTVALYARREAYPEFAEKWERVLAEAKARIPDMLAAAAIASLDPEAAAKAGGRRGRLKVNVDQAIRISAIEAKKAAAGGARGRGGIGPERRAATKAELIAELKKGFAALDRRRRRERLGAGWTQTDDGVWIPPGWVRASPDADGALEGE